MKKIKKQQMKANLEERIRVLSKPNIKEEIQTLLIMENLDKVSNPQYGDWLVKKLKKFYPDVMERLYPDGEIQIKNMD